MGGSIESLFKRHTVVGITASTTCRDVIMKRVRLYADHRRVRYDFTHSRISRSH